MMRVLADQLVTVLESVVHDSLSEGFPLGEVMIEAIRVVMIEICVQGQRVPIH